VDQPFVVYSIISGKRNDLTLKSAATESSMADKNGNSCVKRTVRFHLPSQKLSQ
jgi:hypothetical protein